VRPTHIHGVGEHHPDHLVEFPRWNLHLEYLPSRHVYSYFLHELLVIYVATISHYIPLAHMVLVNSSGLRCNLKGDSKYAISDTELVWVLNISESYADIY
jgi:hypothetical protein